MPNWVSTRLSVTGPADQVAQFKAKAAIVSDDKDKATELSFDPFIPMPASLHVEAGSDGDIGYSVFHGESISSILSYPWVKKEGIRDREGLMLFLDLTRPEARKAGDAYAENIRLHGAKNWYDWSVSHWGTKWDACHVHLEEDGPDELVYIFDTAWSPAEPVLDAMSEQFPQLTFTATFDEESHAFYYEATWENGEKTGEQELEREPDEYGDGDEDDDEADGAAEDGSTGPRTEGASDES